MRRYGIDHTVLVANLDRGPARDRRVGRGRHASARPRCAPSPPTTRTCSSSPAADLEIGRGDFDAARAHLDAARATLREDRELAIYDVYVAELALWERRWTDADDGGARRSGAGALPRHGPDPRLALRQGTARTGRAGGARTRPPRRRRRPRWLGRARTLLAAARARPPRRPHRSRRTPPAGSRWPRPSTSAPAATPGPSVGPSAADDVGAARAPAARGLLPLAPGRGARRRRRVPRRGERAAPRGACRRGSDRSAAPPARARAARRACAARSASPDASLAPSTKHEPGGDPRADAARGGGADARRPRLHQPRDRRRARHQRQDRQRPRLAHPAQARRAEPARGGRHRAPSRSAGRPDSM